MQITGQNLGSPFAIVDLDGDLHVKATISGNIIIGSVSATVDSIYVQSGTMYISSGNVNVAQSGHWYVNLLGVPNVAISGNINVAVGSENYIKNVVGVTPSGTFTVDTGLGSNIYIPAGSVIVTAIPKTEVYTSGIVEISGLVNTGLYAGSQAYVVGSVTVLNPKVVGSWTGQTNGSSYITNYPDFYLGSQSYVIGSVTVLNSVPTGSEVWIKAGSVNQGNSPWIVLGSVYVENQISEITVGSETYVKAGSVVITAIPKTETYISGVVEVSGNVGVIFDSDYLNVVQSGTEWYSTINNPTTIGSYTGQTNGSSYITGGLGSMYIVGGSVNIISMPNFEIATGSESWIKNFNELGSSVVVTNLYAGSKAYQGDVYGVSGIVEVSNMVAGSIVFMPTVNANLTGSLEVFSSTGSVQVYGNLTSAAGSETWVKNFGDLGSSVVVKNVIGVTPSGTFTVDTTLYAGSKVYQGERWGVSGIVEVTGSTYTLEATPTLVSQNDYKTILYLPYSGTAYGLGSNVGSIIKFIGAGSFVKVLTYDASNNLQNIGSWS